jgi:hypothetical protein
LLFWTCFHFIPTLTGFHVHTCGIPAVTMSLMEWKLPIVCHLHCLCCSIRDPLLLCTWSVFSSQCSQEFHFTLVFIILSRAHLWFSLNLSCWGLFESVVWYLKKIRCVDFVHFYLKTCLWLSTILFPSESGCTCWTVWYGCIGPFHLSLFFPSLFEIG